MGDLIRVVKSGDYSLLSNYHLKDKRLSWSAKGLLSTILAFSGEYTIDELEGLSPNGFMGIEGFAELEQYGYLTWKQCGIDSGCPLLEYTIYEKPISRHFSSDPVAEIMDPEDMPDRLEEIDEAELQKLQERLAVNELGKRYPEPFVNCVLYELCMRNSAFRRMMTAEAFEKVCTTVLNKRKEYKDSGISLQEAIRKALDNIQEAQRINRKMEKGVLERES